MANPTRRSGSLAEDLDDLSIECEQIVVWLNG
jgi:hypothetical protein